jgi:predicted nucleotidyltransferase
MKRDDAIRELTRREIRLREMGARALYLFGSTAKDCATEKSDLDVFIDYDKDSRFNAFDLVGVKLFLEEELNANVDLTTRNGLHPALRERIIESSVKVF